MNRAIYYLKVSAVFLYAFVIAFLMARAVPAICDYFEVPTLYALAIAGTLWLAALATALIWNTYLRWATELWLPSIHAHLFKPKVDVVWQDTANKFADQYLAELRAHSHTLTLHNELIVLVDKMREAQIAYMASRDRGTPDGNLGKKVARAATDIDFYLINYTKRKS